MKRIFLRALACVTLLGSIVIATLIPIQGCFDNGTCVTMSLLHTRAGFSQYWNWDYRWGWRIALVAIGVAGVLASFAVTSRNRSGSA